MSTNTFPPSNLTILTLSEEGTTDFAAARNDLLKLAKTEWVLFLDTDETLTPELINEIQNVLLHPVFDAYKIRRVDTFMGEKLKFGETGNAHFVRLARRGYGQWIRPVHEVWKGRGAIGKLTNPILHFSHSTISSFLAKIDRYSTIDANFRYQQNRRSSLLHIFFFPILKFKFNYLLKLGFLDGVPGLIHALMMSYHSYLTWTKLYLLKATRV